MTEEDVLYIHHRLIEDFGGAHGVRDENRIKSAISKLSQSSNSVQAASYFVRDIIQDHPFTDGNKRTAVTIMAIHLSQHSILLTCSPKQLEDFALDVALKKVTIEQIVAWIKSHTK